MAFYLSAHTIRMCFLLVWMFYEWPGDLPLSYSNRDTSWNAWNRRSGSFIVDTDTCILYSNMKSPSDEWHSDPWPLTVTSQPIRLSTNFIPWYRAWPSQNYKWFPFSNPCYMPPGNAYSSIHIVPSPFWSYASGPIVETSFPEPVVSFLDISPWITLGTFSNLHNNF